MNQEIFKNIEKGKSDIATIEKTIKLIKREPLNVFTHTEKLSKAGLLYLANVDSASSIYTPGILHEELLKIAVFCLHKVHPAFLCSTYSSSGKIIKLALAEDRRNDSRYNQSHYTAVVNIFDKTFEYRKDYPDGIENFEEDIKDLEDTIRGYEAKIAEFEAFAKNPMLALKDKRCTTGWKVIRFFGLLARKHVYVSKYLVAIGECEEHIKFCKNRIVDYKKDIEERTPYQKTYEKALPPLVTFFEALGYKIVTGAIF